MFVMFDLDGTLMDSRADLAKAVNLTRLEYGLASLSSDVVAGFVGNGVRKLAERSFRDTGLDIDEVLKKLKTHYMEHIHDHTTLYDGVKDGLHKLRSAGTKVGLVSNKPEEPCRILLRYFELDTLFEVVIGGDSVSKLKPDPTPLLTALQRTGASPDRSWMIGDHHTDLEAARLAGVRSGFVTYGIGSTGDETPAKTFDAFSEITDFFL